MASDCEWRSGSKIGTDSEYFGKAASLPGDSYTVPHPLPPWIDPIKIQEGKKFVRQNFFAVFFAHLISLVFLLCYAPVRKVLLRTQKSDTKIKSLRRYLSTLVHIKRWYEEDALDKDGPAARDIKQIRLVHSGVAKSVGRCALSEALSSSGNCGSQAVEDQVNIEVSPETNPQLCLSQAIKKDFVGSGTWGKDDDIFHSPVHGITQMDMLVTQFCFMGFLTTYPEQFGLHIESEAELEGFVHLWALIGHLLGIEDEFNICLERNKVKRSVVLQGILFPAFVNCQPVTVSLWKSLTDGISSFIPFISLHAILLFVWELVHSSTRARNKYKRSSSGPATLISMCSLYDQFCYFMMSKCFQSWLKVSMCRNILNSLLRLAIHGSSFKYLKGPRNSEVKDARKL